MAVVEHAHEPIEDGGIAGDDTPGSVFSPDGVRVLERAGASVVSDELEERDARVGLHEAREARRELPHLVGRGVDGDGIDAHLGGTADERARHRTEKAHERGAFAGRLALRDAGFCVDPNGAIRDGSWP